MTRCNVRQTHKTLQFLLSFNCYFINTCTDLYTDTKSNKQTNKHTYIQKTHTYMYQHMYWTEWMAKSQQKSTVYTIKFVKLKKKLK